MKLKNLDFFIREMKPTDISRVAYIHSLCFRNSRSTKLGSPFLRRMYRWYITYQPHLSIVAILNENIVGFVTGAIGGNSARKRFRYTFWHIILGFCKNPTLIFEERILKNWRVLMPGLLLRSSWFKDGKKSLRNGFKVTLDSIAVDPTVRGQNIGSMLVIAFEKAAKEQGATYLGLGVESDNTTARNFYERCGWTLSHENLTGKSANYVKDLTQIGF